MNQKAALLPWEIRRHHDSDSFNFCVNAVRECFVRNGGEISRAAFGFWCRRYGQNPSRVEVYFQMVGMTVEHTWRRRSGGKGRRRSCDRFTWRLYDDEPVHANA